MKCIAVIPARLDSVRFPQKMLEILGDQTLIQFTYNTVKNTNLFDDVFVATDSEEISKSIENSKGKVLKTGVHETGTDRIAAATQDIECDIIFNIQGDEPFIQKEALSNLIDCYKNDTLGQIDLASLQFRLTEMDEIKNPNNVKVITDRYSNALYFSRSIIPFLRDAEESLPIYYKHIGVYAFRKQALVEFPTLLVGPLEKSEKIECLRFLENGKTIHMVETHSYSIGIDTPEDLEKARKILHTLL